SNLGMHPAVAGFTFVGRGPDAGQILLTEFGPTDALPVGRDIVKVDPASGSVTPFIANFSGPTDIINDGAGRMLIADYLLPAIYLLTPPGVTAVGSGVRSPEALAIESIEPNPSREGVTISLRLPEAAHVAIEIRDVAGRTVATPFQGWAPAGHRQLDWS